MTAARDAEGNLLPDAERLMPCGRFLRSGSLMGAMPPFPPAKPSGGSSPIPCKSSRVAPPHFYTP